MEDLKEIIRQTIRSQEIQQGMLEYPDICRSYYGKLFLLRRYNIFFINNKYKNREKNDFIPNSSLWEKQISNTYK